MSQLIICVIYSSIFSLLVWLCMCQFLHCARSETSCSSSFTLPLSPLSCDWLPLKKLS